jgi:DNA topoisomerase IB
MRRIEFEKSSRNCAAAYTDYVTDGSPGFRRQRAGRGFVYVDRRGKRVRSPRELARFRSLAIPPAWSDVWISADAAGHLQAVGRDARGRKQYRYHPKWQAVRDRTKYDRMIAFARALPRIRRAVRRDLALPRLPRAKVLGAVVSLLESTHIRVGTRPGSTSGIGTTPIGTVSSPRIGTASIFSSARFWSSQSLSSNTTTKKQKSGLAVK